MTLSGIVVVTGTGTGVGKTVVTAAMAALAHEAGRRVAVVKPGQTGVAVDEPGAVGPDVVAVDLDVTPGDAVELALDPAGPGHVSRPGLSPPHPDRHGDPVAA